MAIPGFPTLPAPLYQGYQESDVDSNVVDGNDLGGGDIRAVTTRVVRKWQFTIECSSAEKTTLMGFHDDTVKKVSPFTWNEPDTGTARTVRFRSRPRPVPFAPDGWRVNCEIEEV
jgi:hypothetical protein